MERLLLDRPHGILASVRKVRLTENWFLLLCVNLHVLNLVYRHTGYYSPAEPGIGTVFGIQKGNNKYFPG